MVWPGSTLGYCEYFEVYFIRFWTRYTGGGGGGGGGKVQFLGEVLPNFR